MIADCTVELSKELERIPDKKMNNDLEFQESKHKETAKTDLSAPKYADPFDGISSKRQSCRRSSSCKNNPYDLLNPANGYFADEGLNNVKHSG